MVMPAYAYLASKGGKRYMEDAVAVAALGASVGLPALAAVPADAGSGGGGGYLLLAVADGHSADRKAGADAARIAAHAVPGAFLAALDDAAAADSRALAIPPRPVLEAVFAALDATLSARSSRKVSFDYAGAAATLAVIALSRSGTPTAIHVANAGDATAVVVDADGSATVLTRPHTIDDEDEVARVVAAGGFVSDDARFGKRVNGLKVTRSLGDFGSDGTISTPHVASALVTPASHWLVVASDGLWDEVTPAELGPLIGSATSPADAVSILHAAARAAADARDGVLDNISIAVVDVAPPPGLE
ncbi:protein phosphatase 2c [Thecamonas trahens ATCC 50062]|uniref:Protein phosphatase 2c n=1 Tax=Thecamonas trahens ATCC 50062 TaxID=461836 RepID=A0A0L0DSP1_THETB|nr:protein phosphatase 2c [Thecamonas trahens ATCC 50062]KNC54473.1 protein phosphatase 2c [Thecamonas trahens ATCC 50062]|eukprot:XP_013753628.1 protein phosphatase 2c [Thecamonas trahens ATCC 50062]